MKSSDPYRIQRLLLGFCALDKRQQDAFLDAVNTYLFASPRQRDRLRADWSAVDGGDTPAAAPSQVEKRA